MSWRSRMKPASFRGVAFHVETAELSGGRRTVTHEYPLRDQPFVEDMGRNARSFQVDGYVIGADYFTSRDALIAALETAGVGELIHPYHGKRNCICSSFRVRESTAEGGMARFTMTFEETPSQPAAPTVVPNPAAKAQASAAQARTASKTDFLKKYAPGTLMASASDAIRSGTLSLDNARTMIAQPTAQAAALRKRIDRLVASAGSLANSPTDIVAELEVLFDAL